jgi:hypothetical protein
MKVSSLLTILVASAFAANANAAVFCQGTINRVGVNPLGVVNVYAPALATDFVYICQIGDHTNGVSPEACKSILATLLSAKAQEKEVRWAFNDSTACGQRPTWSWLQNWYWGPIVMD